MRNPTILIVILLVLLVGGGLFLLLRDGGNSTTTFEYITGKEKSNEGVSETSSSIAPPKETPTEAQPLVEEKMTVSGKYSYSEDSKSSLAGKICFRPTSGLGLSLLCLSNKDEAFALFNIEKGFSDDGKSCALEGLATIEIKSYQKLSGEVGGYDSAIVTRVISKGAPAYIECSS